MKNKKLSGIVLLICLSLSVLFLLFSSGCAKRGTVEPDYSAEIAEKILIAINRSDYESVSNYFNAEFKDYFKKLIDPKTQKTYATDKDAFVNTICKPLMDKIGEYQQGTLKFNRTLTERGYINVFYTAKYSKETKGDVSIQLVFKDENGKMLVAGLWFDSPTLKQ